MHTAAISSNTRILRPAEALQSKQGLLNADAISAESVEARALWMGTVSLPPGARANAHYHADHETAIFVLSGGGEMWYGDGLQEHANFQEGDFIYIGAGVPHLPANPSRTESMVAIIARTDPNEQESVVLLPELDELVD